VSALVIAGTLLLAAALRGLAIARAGTGWGGDHWYWRAWVDEYRRDRRLPPRLSAYVLDEAHWYPPLFPLAVALLPQGIYDRFERGLAVAVDLVRLALLVAVTAALTGADVQALAVAGVTYALTPILVSYNAQLNPRGLGALFLDAGVLLVVAAGPGVAPGWTALGTGLLAGLVLLTHKMTTQLLAFLVLVGALVHPAVLLLALAAPAVAVTLSGGYYTRVARAHGDIVAFWDRNWPWLFGHPVRDSPAYGAAEHARPSTALHRDDLSGLGRRLASLVGFAPASWLALIAVALSGPEGPLLRVAGWLTAVLAFALATTLVPRLRCLGAGYLYTYNAALPSALLFGMLWHSALRPPVRVLWALSTAASIVGVALFLLRLRPPAARDGHWDALVAFLSGAASGPVLCLPYTLADPLAYETGLPVLWGGHGYGFRRLEPFFPRLRLRIPEIVERHAIRYVVIGETSLPALLESDLVAFGARRDFGPYRVFTAVVADGASSSAKETSRLSATD
jgi:hypothetical protein